MKHTPGPWHVGKADKVINYLPIYAKTGVHKVSCIAKTDGHEVGFGIAQSEMESNAHLIAAAPDLLAACKLLLKHATSQHLSIEEQADGITNARLAIAKAEGKP